MGDGIASGRQWLGPAGWLAGTDRLAGSRRIRRQDQDPAAAEAERRRPIDSTFSPTTTTTALLLLLQNLHTTLFATYGYVWLHALIHKAKKAAM
jgi:hypothetical protein